MLAQMMDGCERFNAKRLGSLICEQKVLDEETYGNVITIADIMQNDDWATFLCTALAFWCRGQSEVIPLQWSTVEGVHNFDTTKHSAVCIEQRSQGYNVAIRWGQRKNRPQGSLLRRSCTCADTAEAHCVVHRLTKHASKHSLVSGQKLFPIMSGAAALRTLHKCLKALGTPEYNRFGWKRVCAGCAIAAAAKGIPLPTILDYGEWSTVGGAQPYVLQDVCDRIAQQLRQHEDVLEMNDNDIDKLREILEGDEEFE